MGSSSGKIHNGYVGIPGFGTILGAAVWIFDAQWL